MVPDGTKLLNKDGETFAQQVTGTFLYYSRASYSTMRVALSAIVSEQAIPTENTMKKVIQFLDYSASQEETVITYHTSNMVLECHSDAL